jgi:hypothetical protein
VGPGWGQWGQSPVLQKDPNLACTTCRAELQAVQEGQRPAAELTAKGVPDEGRSSASSRNRPACAGMRRCKGTSPTPQTHDPSVADSLLLQADATASVSRHETRLKRSCRRQSACSRTAHPRRNPTTRFVSPRYFARARGPAIPRRCPIPPDVQSAARPSTPERSGIRS